MSQTVAHLVDHVIRHVPVRKWVLSLPIPLRLLLAAQPELVIPVLQMVQRVVMRHLLDGVGPTSRPSEYFSRLARRRAAWSVVPLAAAGATVQSD